MKKKLIGMFMSLALLLVGCQQGSQPNGQAEQSDSAQYVLVIHGGAGTILKERMTPELEEEYHAALTLALQTGYDVLQAGGSSLDAVEQTIHILEDSPLFNAGKGAVFTNQGKIELDAAIMDGSTGEAGAVAGITTIKNPISAARAVMEKSEHVMLIGAGAEEFAKGQGLEAVDPSYFHTDSRWNALQRALEREAQAKAVEKDDKFGTVGCVALDQEGRITAGTSTGGMNNKRYGRVGDVPIIGAGTYANEMVGISCTGWGEFFIRHVVAYDIAALMEYKGLSLNEATQTALEKVGVSGGDGGLIALDKNGNVSTPFITAGMYRGMVTKDGKIEVAIFKD